MWLVDPIHPSEQLGWSFYEANNGAIQPVQSWDTLEYGKNVLKIVQKHIFEKIVLQILTYLYKLE